MKELPSKELIVAELCRRSLYRFVREFWEVIIPETPVWANHIKYLCDELQKAGERVAKRQSKLSDIIINVPPGSSKSTIASVMFPAWQWTIDPTSKIITTSYSSSLSYDLAGKSRDIVLSKKYKDYFPEVKIKENKGAISNYETTKNGARITTSTGGAITGQHGHILIVDDPQNPELANSEKERLTTNNYVSSTLSTRKVKTKNDVAIMIIVQQRLHPLDVTGFMLSKGRKFKHIILPAELTHICTAPEIYTDGLLDPIRSGREVLDATKSEMGSRAYSAQQNQNPESDDDSVIKEKWLPIMSAVDWNTFTEKKQFFIDYFLDTAYTEKSKNDPSAIIAVTKIENKLYILNASEVRLEAPELIDYIETWTEENGYTRQSRIKIEPKASGKSIVQMFKKSQLNVSESEPPSSSKLERLIAVAPTCEAGKVIIVEGAWNSLLIGQVTSNYPPHDDIRDCFCEAIRDKLVQNSGSGSYKNKIGFA